MLYEFRSFVRMTSGDSPERRSAAGRVLYRTVTGGWNGSDDDKHRLHELLELLQRDPSYLTHDAMLPELNNEFASVSHTDL